MQLSEILQIPGIRHTEISKWNYNSFTKENTIYLKTKSSCTKFKVYYKPKLLYIKPEHMRSVIQEEIASAMSTQLNYEY